MSYQEDLIRTIEESDRREVVIRSIFPDQDIVPGLTLQEILTRLKTNGLFPVHLFDVSDVCTAINAILPIDERLDLFELAVGQMVVEDWQMISFGASKKGLNNDPEMRSIVFQMGVNAVDMIGRLTKG
jgi:hypothetical protein